MQFFYFCYLMRIPNCKKHTSNVWRRYGGLKSGIVCCEKTLAIDKPFDVLFCSTWVKDLTWKKYKDLNIKVISYMLVVSPTLKKHVPCRNL